MTRRSRHNGVAGLGPLVRDTFEREVAAKGVSGISLTVFKGVSIFCLAGMRDLVWMERGVISHLFVSGGFIG